MPGGRTGGPGGTVCWVPADAGGGGAIRGELDPTTATSDRTSDGDAGATWAAETSGLFSRAGTV